MATGESEAGLEYCALGRVAHEQLQLDEAEQWYRKAQEVFERLDLKREAAAVYHQLGQIAEERGQFEQAEAWCNRALGIYLRLGIPPLIVNTLVLFGLIGLDQGRPAEAVSRFGQALGFSLGGDKRANGRFAALFALAQLLRKLGEKDFRAAWRTAFPGQEPPMDLLRPILKSMEDNPIARDIPGIIRIALNTPTDVNGCGSTTLDFRPLLP